MSIILKSRREIEKMHEAGRIVARVLSKLKECAEPGMSTLDLDEIAFAMTEELGADALFRGVRSPYAKRSFPGAICASLNEEVVHGIPSSEVKLCEGDILSVDFGVRYQGYCGDSAVTFGIGSVSSEKSRLMEATSKTLEIAETTIRPGLKWSDVAGRMQGYAESQGYSVVKDYVGHGIGREMHEDPRLPNYVCDELLQDDIHLTEGMVLAVEPMINIGKDRVRTLRNGWTVVTTDGKSSAHFEHTIAVLADGCEVLTRE